MTESASKNFSVQQDESRLAKDADSNLEVPILLVPAKKVLGSAAGHSSLRSKQVKQESTISHDRYGIPSSAHKCLFSGTFHRAGSASQIRDLPIFRYEGDGLLKRCATFLREEKATVVRLDELIIRWQRSGGHSLANCTENVT